MAGPAWALDLEPVLAGLASPLYVTHARDGSGRLFVVEQGGIIKVLGVGSATPTVFLDITGRVLSGGEQGLLGLAFHPRYASNGRLFVNYTRQPDGATVIAEYRRSSDPQVASPDEIVLLTIAQPFANHNGGMIEFGPDGFLYIATGDGGAGNDPDNRAQNPNDLLGKILRIDVDISTTGLPYGIPASNPFAGAVTGRGEIYALGLRNPFRFSFDRATGQLLVGDVGEGAWEEINVVTAGGNYGWRVFEGMQCTGLGPAPCSSPGFIPPIAQYAHAAGRCAVTGGYIYRGSRGTLPVGTYVFADFCSGEIFILSGDIPTVLLGTGTKVSSFGEDEAGELYVVGLGGTVHKLIGQENAPSIVVGLGAGARGWLEMIASVEPFFHVSWPRVEWPNYNTMGPGETRPAACDVDGDGLRELVLGLGRGSAGWLEVLKWTGTGWVHQAWFQVGWSPYNAANGETFPACGDLDGDGRDEIVVGLGPGGGGWVQIFDDATTGFAPMAGTPTLGGWIRLGWPPYNSVHGEVHPAVGDLDGDGRAEIVLGLGRGGAGWLQVFGDRASGFLPIATPFGDGWIRSTWDRYNDLSGETRPVVCDLNSDGRAEIVLGLGSGAAGWIQILGDRTTGFAPLAGTPTTDGWVQVGWPAYNAANGETFPACADLDGNGRPELILGLGAFPTTGGWVEIKEGVAGGFAIRRWIRVDWEQYNAVNGLTRPAVAP